MLLLLSVDEPIAKSVGVVAMVAPPAVADSWQLLSACTIIAGTAQTPDTVRLVLPIMTACSPFAATFDTLVT